MFPLSEIDYKYKDLLAFQQSIGLFKLVIFWLKPKKLQMSNQITVNFVVYYNFN